VKRIVLCAAAALAMVAPASATGPLVITPAKTGKTYTLAVGAEATIRFSHQRRWSRPIVGGRAIRLARVDYFRDPGFDEWRVLVVREGTSTIRSTSGARRFRVTIVARG
jgi:hypothetical protein